MTSPDDIAQIHARHLAIFNRLTPFGVKLPEDRHLVLRCTARDARVTLETVQEIVQP